MNEPHSQFKQATADLRLRVITLQADIDVDVTSVIQLLQSPQMHTLIKDCVEDYQRTCVAGLVESISKAAEQGRTVWLRRELATVERLCDEALAAVAWHQKRN